MLTYLKFPVVVTVWMVALMSGILSLAREAYGIYSGTIPARSVFWSCMLAAFVLSATISWAIEHKKFRDEKNKNEIAPDIEVQVTSTITKGVLGSGVTDLFTHLILTLKAPSEVVIREFSLTAQRGTEYLHAPAVDDTIQWEVMKENPDGGYLHIPCTPVAKHLRQRGDPVAGWIHFRMGNVKESWLLKSMLWVKVNSVHGTCLKEAPGSHAFPDVKTKGVMRRLGGS